LSGLRQHLSPIANVLLGELRDDCPQPHAGDSTLGIRVTRLWRWLTCGHGRHDWERRLGVDLAYDDRIGDMVIGRYCPRCGTVDVIKTLELERGMVYRYPAPDVIVGVQEIPE
jgi:hypothetical protein